MLSFCVCMLYVCARVCVTLYYELYTPTWCAYDVVNAVLEKNDVIVIEKVR